MSGWWSTVDRTFLFLLSLPILVALAGYLRYRWDERRQQRQQSVLSWSALYLFWLLLSGSAEPFLAGAGAVSAGAVVLLGHRMALIDREGQPLHLTRNAVTYWPWLVKEMAKSAVQVSKVILKPKLDLSPRMVSVTPSQRTSVGVVTYANSITLTPGTISIDVAKDGILVHALTAEGAKSLEEGDMDRRVARFEAA